MNGIQEVSGSIPLISTMKRDIRSDVSFHGGDKRDRTADLLNAIQALSQLSYTPIFTWSVVTDEIYYTTISPFVKGFLKIPGHRGKISALVPGIVYFLFSGKEIKAIPRKSTRESDERFFVRKRCKTAGILCVFQGQYRTNRQESLTRDFSSEKGGKPQEYFVYFKVFLTNFWRKRSVRIRRRICAVLP